MFFAAYVSLAASYLTSVRPNVPRGGKGRQRKSEEIAMDLRTDRSRKIPPRPLIECGQCGERLFLPEWSEFVDERRMRHLWACDVCGYQFETTVRFRAAA
jgi:transcription elongation factor Elf1